MRKGFLIALGVLFLSWGQARAASLEVKLEEPKSPSNQKDFRLGFVALDVEGRSVEVDCYYKKPLGSFTKWETKNLPAGGESEFCQVGGGQITERGTYQFYVIAKAGGESTTSSTVSVEYDDLGPGTPVSYSKEVQADACSYKIKFKTADDSGETARVDLFRSEAASFSVDGSTRIASQGIGSNLAGEFYTSLPDCSKTYYFALRAFDGHGNGSGVIGDSGGAVVIDETAETGAIAVNESQVGNPGNGSGQGQVLGDEESQDPDGVSEDQDTQLTQDSQSAMKEGGQKAGLSKGVKYALGVIVLGIAGYFLMKFFSSRQ